MIKKFGFGIVCLLVASGISQAGVIKGDDKGKDYGKDDHGPPSFKVECKPSVGVEIKHLEFDIKHDEKILKDLKHDLKNEKFCDFAPKCDFHPWVPECGPVCDKGPSMGGACSVPLPASSAMGGIGAALVALLTFVRSKKASIA